jgi:hypothetical protein
MGLRRAATTGRFLGNMSAAAEEVEDDVRLELPELEVDESVVLPSSESSDSSSESE